MSSTLCPLPFTHQHIEPSGEIKFCCAAVYNSNKDSQDRTFNVTTHKLSDAWNSEYYKQLRLDLIAGNEPEACRECWKKENKDHSGGASVRINSLERIPADTYLDRVDYATKNNGALDVKPFDFQVMAGNLCNLACKMCGPTYSTGYSKFFKNAGYQKIQDVKFSLLTQKGPDDDDLGTKYDWPVTYPLKNIFNEYYDSLTNIYITGGEPTLLDENIEFIEDMANSEYSANMRVGFTTNCTNINQRLLNALDKLQSVSILISLDGMGDIAHIQRYPSDWPTIEKNFDTLLSWAHSRQINNQAGRVGNVHIGVNSVLTSLNAHHYPEFWMYLTEKQKKLKYRFGMSVNTLVSRVDNFGLEIIPKVIAKKIHDDFLKIEKRLPYNWRTAIRQYNFQLASTNFIEDFDNIHFMLDELQRVHPELNIKEIYSIYYQDAI